jgi:hypothetical protein
MKPTFKPTWALAIVLTLVELLFGLGMYTAVWAVLCLVTWSWVSFNGHDQLYYFVIGYGLLRIYTDFKFRKNTIDFRR